MTLKEELRRDFLERQHAPRYDLMVEEAERWKNIFIMQLREAVRAGGSRALCEISYREVDYGSCMMVANRVERYFTEQGLEVLMTREIKSGKLCIYFEISGWADE